MVGAFPDGGSRVHGNVEFGAHQLEVVVQPDAGNKGQVIGGDEQW
jgi:hypothetical protein